MLRRLCCWLLVLVLTACSHQPKMGKYSIGRDPTWFPLNFGQETPNINAFVNALVQAINKAEKVNIQIVENSWSDHLRNLDAKEVAGIFTSMPLLEMNQDQYDFSDPFLLLGPVLVVRSQMTAHSLDELKGKAVGVCEFDDSVLLVQKHPSITIQMYQSVPQALEMLAAGQVDALLVPSLRAHALVPHLYPGVLRIASGPLSNKGLRVMTLKGENHKLIEVFNKGLKTLEDNGTYLELRNHYGVH